MCRRFGQRLFGACIALALLFGCRTAHTPDAAPRTPPPAVAFPRQSATTGQHTYMTALLVGMLERDGRCLWVRALHGEERVLPIWPPELDLVAQDGRLLVINPSIPTSGPPSLDEQVVAVVGEEVSMAGGYVATLSESDLAQVPPECRGSYFVVGDPLSVRPNLREHSELFSWQLLTADGRAILVLHHTPAFAALAGPPQTLAGELVWYQGQRCLQLQTGRGPGPVTLLWPSGWHVRLEGGTAVVIDEARRTVARTGDPLVLRGRPIPQSWESETYRRAVQELPSDCCCVFWLVEGLD